MLLPEPGSLTRNRVATFVFFGVQGFAFSLLVSKVPEIKHHLHLDDGTLSILLAVVPVLAGVGSVTAGVLMRWTTSATLLRIAEPTVVGVLIAVPHTHNLWQAMPILMVFGLAVGMADATMNMQACGLERRYGRSIVLAFFGVWAAGAIAGSGWGATTGVLHMSVTYAIGAVVGIGFTLVAGPSLLKNLRDETVVKDAEGRLPKVPWRPMALLCVIMTLAYIGESSVTNAGSVFLTDGLKASDTVGGLVIGAYTLGQVVGRLPGDLLVREYGAVKVVRFGAVLCVLGFATVVGAADSAMAIAGFFLAGLGLSPLVPQAFVAADRNDPAGSGVAVARINVFNYLGFLLGAPLVTGLWGAGVSHREGMAVPLVMIGAIILLAFAFDPRRSLATGEATPAVGDAETVPTLGG